MEYQDIQQFFTDYVAKYAPYRDVKLQSVLINNILENFVKDSYIDIPCELKSLYEDSTIIETVYDQLLLGIGVPTYILNQLTASEKSIFLKTLSDFKKYNGSILFFKNVCKGFDDKFDIYELYCDSYTHTDEITGQTFDEWVLKPYLIYKGTEFKIELDTLDYDSVYNQVPNLLISSTQLTEIKSSHQSCFPLKTNLLLLNYNIEYDVSLLNNLMLATFLKEFGDTQIIIYLADTTFVYNLKQIYFIWNYILCMYYQTPITEFPIRQVIAFLDGLNPYFMSDIAGLQDELSKITSSDKIVEFYNEKIYSHFATNHRAQGYELDRLDNLMALYAPEFLNYFNERLAPVFNNTQLYKKDVKLILSEVYNSMIIVYHDYPISDFKTYFEKFLYSLPEIIVNPKDTASYLILSNMKSFHVDLLTEAKTSIRSCDPFNNMTPGIDYDFLMKVSVADFCDELLNDYHFLTLIDKKESIDMIVTNTFHPKVPQIEDYKDYLKEIIIMNSTVFVLNVYDIMSNKFNALIDINIKESVEFAEYITSMGLIFKLIDNIFKEGGDKHIIAFKHIVSDALSYLNLIKFNSTYSTGESASIISNFIYYTGLIQKNILNILDESSVGYDVMGLHIHDIVDNGKLSLGINEKDNTDIFEIINEMLISYNTKDELKIKDLSKFNFTKTVLDVVNHLNLSKFNSTYSQLESATIISIQIHYLNILKYEFINMLETISPHCGLHELSNFDISDNTSLTYNYNQTNIFDINDTFEVTIS